MRRSATWLCLALVANTACKRPQERPPPPEVLVAQVAQRDVPIERIYLGYLRGFVDVDIRARVEGYLLGQHYEEGGFVERDQLLFQIDPAPFLAALRDAQGNLANAEAELQRTRLLARRLQPLAKELAVSQQDLDNALAARASAAAAVKSANAVVRQAELNLSYTEVLSPIGGLAGAALVRLGNLIGAGEPTLLTTVSQIDPMRAVFPITETDYLELAKSGTLGAQRAVHLELNDGASYPEPGELSFADRQIDPSTGTLLMEAFFPNPQALLRPGQAVRVHVSFETIRSALVVQQRAISEIQGMKRVVLIGEGDVAHFINVQLGPTIGDEVVVTGALQAGDRVAVEGGEKVRDGAAVRPLWAPPPNDETGTGQPSQRRGTRPNREAP